MKTKYNLAAYIGIKRQAVSSSLSVLIKCTSFWEGASQQIHPKVKQCKAQRIDKKKPNLQLLDYLETYPNLFSYDCDMICPINEKT